MNIVFSNNKDELSKTEMSKDLLEQISNYKKKTNKQTSPSAQKPILIVCIKVLKELSF